MRVSTRKHGVPFTWAQPQRSIGQGSPDIRSGKRPADEDKIRGGGRRLVGLGRVELPTSPLSVVNRPLCDDRRWTTIALNILELATPAMLAGSTTNTTLY